MKKAAAPKSEATSEKKKAAPAKALKADKPAAAKKAPAAKKPAKVETPTAEPKRKATKSTTVASPATVVVRHDAGWGNALFLRGEGPGLSWDVGAPLCCVNGTEWVWVAPAPGTITFKVLHNDHAWAIGENLVAAAGETVTVNPAF